MATKSEESIVRFATRLERELTRYEASLAQARREFAERGDPASAAALALAYSLLHPIVSQRVSAAAREERERAVTGETSYDPRKHGPVIK